MCVFFVVLWLFGSGTRPAQPGRSDRSLLPRSPLPWIRIQGGGRSRGGGVKNRGKETERRSVQGQKKSVSPHRSTLKQGGKDQTFMNHSTFLNVCTFGFFLNKLFGLNPAKLNFFHWGVISLSFLKIQITKLDTRVFCPHSKAERFLLHSGFSKIGGSDRKQLIMANKKTTPPIKM